MVEQGVGINSNVAPYTPTEENSSRRRGDMLRRGSVEIAGREEDASGVPSGVPKRLLPRRSVGSFDYGGGANSAHTTTTEARNPLLYTPNTLQTPETESARA